MERIFPFLHEDVLYIINEYAREHTEKKELFNDIFKNYLKRNLEKVKINDKWVHWIMGIEFKNLEKFIHIIEMSQSMYINTHLEHCFIKNKTDLKLHNQYNRIPMGPKIKIYHYFINNVRFAPRGIYPQLL